MDNTSKDLQPFYEKYIQNGIRDELGNLKWGEDCFESLYAILPAYMKYETLYHEKEKYNDILEHFVHINRVFKDPVGKLLQRETGKPCVMANAYYVAALADVLEYMDETIYDEYRTLQSFLKETVVALIQQVGEDGIWHKRFENARPVGETASLLIGRAILKGIRLELIPARYKEIAITALTKCEEMPTDDPAYYKAMEELALQ